MSATQTAKMMDTLMKERPLTKVEAAEFLDYVEEQRGDTATKQDVENTKTELKQDIKALRTELKQDIKALRTELKQDIKALRTELKNEIELVRKDVEAVRTELKQDINWLKWIVGVGFTIGFGLLLTIMLYLHNDTKLEMKEMKSDIEIIKRLLQSK